MLPYSFWMQAYKDVHTRDRNDGTLICWGYLEGTECKHMVVDTQDQHSQHLQLTLYSSCPPISMPKNSSLVLNTCGDNIIMGTSTLIAPCGTLKIQITKLRRNTIQIFIWFQINRKILNTIWFRVDLIRFRKDFSIYIYSQNFNYANKIFLWIYSCIKPDSETFSIYDVFGDDENFSSYSENKI